MPGVTISADYGAGGSVVAPHVARLLGLPLLDRAISSHVAAQLRVSVKEAEGGAARRSLPDRFISALVPLAAGVIATSTDTLPRACGTAVLQGDSYGGWNFSLGFNTEVVGVAVLGGVTVSTNALLGADSKGFGVSGGYEYHDALRDGDLSSIGWGATADTLNGWALTAGGWYCGIDVTAPWQF